MSALDRIEASTLAPEDELTLFRICRVPLGEPSLLDAFVSSYQGERPPRGWEQRNVLIQMGLSTYVRSSQAEDTARRFPRIGAHVARLVLRHGYGFAVAATGPAGHMTIWGRPLSLMGAVVDTNPIEF